MKKIKLNSSGSALVTVIVFVAFISILATTLLYVSGANYQMKMTDYHIKENFYSAEEPIELVKAKIVKEIEASFNEVQPYMMVSMGSRINSDQAQITYENKFYEVLVEKCKNDLPAVVTSVNAMPGVKEFTINGGHIDTAFVLEDGYLNILNLDLTYMYDGYTCYITTDLRVVAPVVSWPCEYSPRTLATPAPTAAPGASAAPAASAIPSGDLDFTKCVYYNKWVKN